MGVAYYVVLNNDEPGFDTFVNGKALAREAETLASISRTLGISAVEDFISMSNEDFEDLLGEEIEAPNEEELWFPPDEGIALVEALADYIRANPNAVKDRDAVLDDLKEYADVFARAKGIGAQWHLKMDI